MNKRQWWNWTITRSSWRGTQFLVLNFLCSILLYWKRKESLPGYLITNVESRFILGYMNNLNLSVSSKCLINMSFGMWDNVTAQFCHLLRRVADPVCKGLTGGPALPAPLLAGWEGTAVLTELGQALSLCMCMCTPCSPSLGNVLGLSQQVAKLCSSRQLIHKIMTLWERSSIGF